MLRRTGSRSGGCVFQERSDIALSSVSGEERGTEEVEGAEEVDEFKKILGGIRMRKKEARRP